MSDDCIFCKIIRGEIPSARVYEDEYCYAFRDIHPQAPTHVLIVTKAHVADLSEAAALPDGTLAGLIRAVGKVADKEGLESYRVIANRGEDACQTVRHLHLHVLGGRKMSEEMA